jgi:hypothetical protein
MVEIINNEYESIKKGAVVVKVEVLFWNLTGGSEENRRNPVRIVSA